MKRFLSTTFPDQIQSRLLFLAGIFLFLNALILTLAPAVRERTWSVDFNFNQWLGFTIWVIIFTLAHIQTRNLYPDADQFILPIAALLTGWGILTIYRLLPTFGFRQTAWLLIGGIVFLIGLRLSPNLQFLRRYKYIWLIGGLFITALTVVFGVDPGGGNERAWLGCCGFYFQPSEPLKLLLIVFLAAYLSDRIPISPRSMAPFIPTAVVMGVALLLLVIQRDLGTATIFIFLYTIIYFISSGKKRILLFSLIGLLIAGVMGYLFFDLIRLRVDAWLNPWLDPSGRSFQIVQSLMAVANGGTSGRGPGLGNPGLVPVAISDFIFSAIAEETGLVGTLGLIMLIGFFTSRGIRIALRAPDNFRRILASGLTAYVCAQSILIIGGNIRLLPLTGVTLPFVSYGGSSLLTSFMALLLLLLISSQSEEDPAPLPKPQPYFILAGIIGLGLISIAATNAWWAVWRGPSILDRTDNARRSIADRYVKRGSLLDSHETAINITVGKSGEFIRSYLYPELAPITGYTNPIYGQSGLEASLDPYLRGLQGNPARSIWWDHLVYGQPPPGLNVRLSLDLGIQQKADELLGTQTGTTILINASSGEILAMASHPTFNPNNLNADITYLLQNPNSPLLDRAAQGMYSPGNIMTPFFQAAGFKSWPSQSSAERIYSDLGFFLAPELHIPVASISKQGSALLVSPLQMVLATATLSNEGVRPSPRLAMAVETPTQGWVVLPALGEPVTVFPALITADTVNALMQKGQPFWQWKTSISQESKYFSWCIGGTLPQYQGVPLAVVVLLEENNVNTAGLIAQTLLEIATTP
jgi:cell division protein FtsW (lipid II flippase)